MSLNRQERYMERQHFHAGELEISERAYNLVLGGTLLYGFLVNCFMVKFCYGFAVSLVETSGWLFFGLYFVMCMAGSALVNRSVNPVVSFIGYNLIVIPLGLVVSIVVNAFVSAGYTSTVVAAFGITSLVTVGMMLLSTVFPSFFPQHGKNIICNSFTYSCHRTYYDACRCSTWYYRLYCSFYLLRIYRLRLGKSKQLCKNRGQCG